MTNAVPWQRSLRCRGTVNIKKYEDKKDEEYRQEAT